MENSESDTGFVDIYSQNDRFEDEFIHPVIFEFLGDPQGKDIIEYGCGEGELAFMLANEGADVLWLDISEEMIKNARQKWKHQALSFKQMYENRMPVQDGSIDAIVSNLVLMMVPSLDGIQTIMHEAYRALRPQGKIVFTITNPAFVDKEFSTYRNIFKDGFRYNETGQPYQFVLKTRDGREITDKTFRDYHYRWEDYINVMYDSGLRHRVREIQTPDDYPPYVVFCGEK